MPSRNRRILIAALLTVSVVLGLVLSVRWLLGPENLARVITAWVEREWQARLSLREAPGVRLIPRLQLSLRGVQLERDGDSIATAEELNIALPWSTLWTGGVRVESLSLRRPVLNWPALSTLLGDLAEHETGPRAPRLPQIEVGIRIEDGELYSGSDLEDWRLDRISLVTTPLLDGERFHLDAGARLRGQESRSLSLTLRTVPRGTPRELKLDDIVARLVVSPDGMPLNNGMVVEINGELLLDARGPARIDIDGRLPGWPDWLPNLLEFHTDETVELTVRWLDDQDGAVLVASLGQNGQVLEARLDGRDLRTAMAKIDRPLAALLAIRGQWRLDSLRIGELEFEGIDFDVRPVVDPDAND